MKTNKKTTETDQSVLVLYSIDNDDIFDMSINEIWTYFIISSVRGVKCRNVYQFDVTPEDLLTYIKSSDFLSTKLSSDIYAEYESGANVMFVSPVGVGNPIDGFLLPDSLFN